MVDIVLDENTGSRTLTFPKDNLASIFTDISEAVKRGDFDNAIENASKEIGKKRQGTQTTSKSQQKKPA
jgi:hypothetical protein